MEMLMDILEKLYQMTAFGAIGENPMFLVMYLLAFVLLYLGIVKKYEPLLLVPIAFGVLIANFPGGGMGVIQADSEGMVPVTVNGVTTMKNIYSMPLHEIAHDLGLMNYLYYALIKSGLLPPSSSWAWVRSPTSAPCCATSSSPSSALPHRWESLPCC